MTVFPDLEDRHQWRSSQARRLAEIIPTKPPPGPEMPAGVADGLTRTTIWRKLLSAQITLRPLKTSTSWRLKGDSGHLAQKISSPLGDER
jgi:hypothetical protein